MTNTAAASEPEATNNAAESAPEATGTAPVDPNSGPTVAEWVLAGYPPSAYPPTPYVSKSTDEQIAELVALEEGGATKEEIAAAATAQQVDQPAADVVEEQPPAPGTSKAAEAHLADFPDHPTQPGAKIVDRPLTRGATG